MSAVLRREIHLPTPGHRLCAALVGVLCGGLYLRTLAPTALWYDMAEMAATAYHLSIAHNTGYPLFMLLGKLFTYLPFGDIAYRVNLMSAFFATGTVVVLFFIVWDLARRRGAAILAALTLGVSSTLWSNATLTESYALNAFFVALLTYLLLTWQRTGRRAPLLGAFYVLGLAMGNHHLIQFFGPAMLAYWFMASDRTARRRPLQQLLGFALLFVAGFAINLYLPIRAAQSPPMMWADASEWETFLRMITVGRQRTSVFQSPAASVLVAQTRLLTVTLFPLHEFTVVGLALALWGAVSLWRRNRPLLVHGMVGSSLTLMMILVYGIHNIFQYFLPIYVMMAVWLGQGIACLSDALVGWRRKPRDDRVPLVSARALSLISGLLLLGLPTYLLVRDFQVLDRSGDRSAYDFANYLAARLEPDAAVLADFWAWAPLAYYQSIGGWRPDVDLYPQLSMPEVDWDTFPAKLKSTEKDIYVIPGFRLPADLLTRVELHLVALNVVETMPVSSVPSPRYKDTWLAMTDVFRLVDEPADVAVHAVPDAHALDPVRFGDLELVGFGGPVGPMPVGSATTLSYYWKVSEHTDADYYVSVRFEDAEGYVHLLRGFPIWDHSHHIGWTNSTSGWAPGTIMGERLDMIVPWRVLPGEYTVRAWIYEDEQRTKAVLADDLDQPEQGVVLGHITVAPRKPG